MRKGCAWADIDNDGDLDLFVAVGLDGNDLLYRNNGDGTFTKVTAGSIVTSRGSSRGCAWADYDRDGFVDLFVANERGENNFLFHNNGDGTFARITDGRIVRDGGNSTACAWGDYDNDGYPDLFVANNNENNFLYHNNRDGTFTRILGALFYPTLWVSRRFQVTRPTQWRRIMALLVCGAIFSVVHLVLYVLVRAVVYPEDKFSARSGNPLSVVLSRPNERGILLDRHQRIP